MRRILMLLCLILPLAAARADALTVRDVIELSKAGVGEDVLLALVEVDRGIFPNDVATIKALKQAGVSEKVITAMVRKGRMPQEPPAAPAPEPEPQITTPPIVIEHHDIIEHHDVEQVMVPYTVYPFPVFVSGGRRTHQDTSVTTVPSSLVLSGAPIVPAGAPILPVGRPLPIQPCSDANPWYRVGSLCR